MDSKAARDLRAGDRIDFSEGDVTMHVTVREIEHVGIDIGIVYLHDGLEGCCVHPPDAQLRVL